MNRYDKYEQLYAEAISAAPNHRKGTKCSDETRARMSAAQRKMYAEKGHGTTKNTVWVNNGVKDIMVKASELDKYLAEGYKRGRLYRHSPETIAKVVSKTTGRQVTDAFRERMREVGKLSNLNRGEDWRHKISEAKKAYYQTHLPYWKGKTHSEEAKKRISDAKSNRVRIDKGDQYKIVKKDEVEKYVKEGWSMHVNIEYVKTTDWMFVTDGTINKRIHQYELDKYEKQGFRIGVTRKK